MKTSILLLLALAAVNAGAQSPCAITDDVPDTVAQAQTLTPGAAISRRFERRNDRDLFCFRAFPDTAYTITVAPAVTGGPTDTEFRVLHGDGVSLLARASSSGTRTQAQTVIPAASFARQLYIDARPFAEYSQGDYTLQLTAGAFTDGDLDGLPDAWETANGLSASDAGSAPPYTHGPNGDPDGDGMTNREEWLAGTHPMSAASVLRLTILQVQGQNNRELRWPAPPFARYQIWRGLNPVSPGWSSLGFHLQPDASGQAVYTDPSPVSPTSHIYRVELAY